MCSLSVHLSVIMSPSARRKFKEGFCFSMSTVFPSCPHPSTRKSRTFPLRELAGKLMVRELNFQMLKGPRSRDIIRNYQGLRGSYFPDQEFLI